MASTCSAGWTSASGRSAMLSGGTSDAAASRPPGFLAAGPGRVPAGPAGPWPSSPAASCSRTRASPLSRPALCRGAEEAVAAAAALGFPVVLKAQAEGLAHKSDMGGVMVGLSTTAAVAEAFATIARPCPSSAAGCPLRRRPGHPDAPGGAGAARLDQPGPGLRPHSRGRPRRRLGGAPRHVGLRVLPVSRGDVLDLLADLRTAPLLNGHRGPEPVNLRRVADAGSACARLRWRSVRTSPRWKSTRSGAEATRRGTRRPGHHR